MKLGIKDVFIIILCIGLVISFIMGQKKAIDYRKGEIEKLHEENEKLVAANDSLISANQEIDNQFDELVLKSEKPVLVDFFAVPYATTTTSSKSLFEATILTFKTLSKLLVALESTWARLASFKMVPTDCTDPSAMSTPVFATSPTTSAVLLRIDPVVYPKMERICETRGPKIETIVFIKSPRIVKIFMPKNERESNTNSTIIIVRLSIPPVESEFIIGCCN